MEVSTLPEAALAEPTHNLPPAAMDHSNPAKLEEDAADILVREAWTAR
jgi:hypothetical protein